MIFSMKKNHLYGLLWLSSILFSFLFGKNFAPVIERKKVIYKEKVIEKKVRGTTIEKNKIVEESVKEEKKKSEEKESRLASVERVYRDRTLMEKALQDCSQGMKLESEKNVTCYDVMEYFMFRGESKKFLNQSYKSCLSGNIDSCQNISYQLDQTKDKGKIQSMKLLLKSKCEEGVALACETVASMLYDRSHKDPLYDQRLEYSSKACDLDAKQCSSLAWELQSQNDPRAGEFFIKSCDSGESYMCYNASNYFFRKGQRERGVQMLETGCYRDSVNICRRLLLYLVSNGQNSKATMLRNDLCEKDKTEFCLN